MNAHPEDFNTLCEADYVDFDGINGFNEFDLQDFTVSEDGTVTMSGVVYVSVEIGVYSYNWSYERDEDDSRYICVGSGEVQIHYAFDLTVSKDGERENLSLTLLNIESDIGNR